MEENKKNFNDYWKTANPNFYILIKDKRKEMRDNLTFAEQILWERIRSKQILGVKFRRQHIIGDYITDFVSLSNKLIIEVDGKIHDFQQKKDELRTNYLREKGFKVIRFKNEEIIEEIEKVLDKIKIQLNK